MVAFMSHDPTLTAGDIARLAGVGRAAVSNWRRRHDDFPLPIGGTANQPLFSLPQVEAWLRRYGKSYQLSPGDRAWQRLKTAGDLRLGEAVAEAGALLTSGESDLDPEQARLVSELADHHDALTAYEFLVERYTEAHSRQLSVTRDDIAALMVALVGEARTVLDPACGVGTLLLHAAGNPAAGGRRLLGQELNGSSASIAATRLRLRGADVTAAAGDSPRPDAFAAPQADAVICAQPFNARAPGRGGAARLRPVAAAPPGAGRAAAVGRADPGRRRQPGRGGACLAGLPARRLGPDRADHRPAGRRGRHDPRPPPAPRGPGPGVRRDPRPVPGRHGDAARPQGAGAAARPARHHGRRPHQGGPGVGRTGAAPDGRGRRRPAGADRRRRRHRGSAVRAHHQRAGRGRGPAG